MCVEKGVGVALGEVGVHFAWHTIQEKREQEKRHEHYRTIIVSVKEEKVCSADMIPHLLSCKRSQTLAEDTGCWIGFKYRKSVEEHYFYLAAYEQVFAD